MVVNIGINPLEGKIAVYKSLSGEKILLETEQITPSDTDKVENLFSTLKNQFDPLCSKVCVCIDGKYGNDIRVEFVESAKKHNFKNFGILDFTSALYFYAAYGPNFKPESNDKIWIIWSEYCYVYKHYYEKVVFLECHPYFSIINRNIISKIEKPFAIFCQSNLKRNALNLLCPKSYFFDFPSFSLEDAALCKAKDIYKKSIFKVQPICGRKIEIVCNGKILFTILSHERLPYKKVKDIGDSEEPLILKITEDDNVTNKITLHSKCFVFSINLNGIYSVNNFEHEYTSIKKTKSTSSVNELQDISDSPTSLKRTVKTSEDKNIQFEVTMDVTKLNYIIPENLKSYVELVHLYGLIQIELNILNPLVTNSYLNFDFNNFETLLMSHNSYEEAITKLDAKIDGIKNKCHTYIERSDHNINDLKNEIDDFETQYKNLYRDFYKNKEFLQRVEIYLKIYKRETEWMDEHLSISKMNIDNMGNFKEWLNMNNKLKETIKDHKNSCENVINEGQQLLTMMFNKEANESFITFFQEKWKDLQKYLPFIEELTANTEKAIKIKDWIKDCVNSVKHDGSEIDKQSLIKINEKQMDNVEVYFENIRTFGNETNKLVNEIMSYENFGNTSIISKIIQMRFENINRSYNDLVKMLKEKIQMLKNEKTAMEFKNECDFIENWIKDTLNSFKECISYENLDALKRRLSETDLSLKSKTENELANLTKTAEMLPNEDVSALKAKVENIYDSIKDITKMLKFITNYIYEIEWINSKLIKNDFTFDSIETCMNSSIDFEKLNTEMKLHEKTVQKIIRITKKIFLDSNGDNTLNSILEKKWNELQQYVHLYSSIISKIKEVVKCCEATNTVEEGIRVICKYHNQLIINSDTTEKEELLAAVENCYNKLQTIENDSSSLINDPILKEYAPNVLIFLESRITLVKALFTEVQNAIKKQIKKEDELSEKYFYVECEAIEHWIKHTIELMNTDFDYDEIERMEKLLQTTKNIMAVKCSKMTIKMVKFADEQFEAGFAEARLKIQKINEAYIKLGNIIHEKGFYIENLKIIYKFFDEQESLLLFAKHQRKMIYSINDNNQLPEYEQMLKELEEKILQLICRSENIVKLNFEDEIKAKIKVLQETINSLWRLLEAKYQNLKLTYDLVDFYEIAQEALTCFEECFGELEASDQMSLKLSILIKNESSDYTLFYAEKIGIQLFNGYKRNNSVPAFTLARKYMQKVVQAKEIWNVIYQKLEKGIPYFKEIEEFDKISCGVKHFLNGFPIEGKSDNEMKKQESLAEIDCKIEQLVQIAKEITEKEKNLAEYFYMNLHGIKKMYQLCFDNDDQKDEKSFEEKPSLLPIHSTIKFVSSAPNSTNEKYLIPKKLKLYDDKINAVGIDLGTSRCCTAVNRNNKMETVALDNNGERPLPSYVSFDEKDEKCGKIVVDGLLKNLEKFTCFDIKRIIGKKYSNIISDKSWPFTIIEKNGKIFVKTANSHGEITKTPEEISAVLLKYIKEKVSTFQGKTLTEAVLTVPAAFTEKQKEATLKAAKLAGWEKIHLLPEPVAASFAYFNNREIPNNSNVLLFDLGGGTLDVCLFHINEGSLKIITSNGNTCLGGRDIDNLLMRHFTTALKFKYNINVNKKVKRKYQLLIECQNIKHNLSVRESDLLDPEKFDSGIEGGSIEIERCELEEMMTELIQRMKLIIIETLENAKMDHNEVNKVLLVGGGCRMPIVKTMLKNMFPNADQCCEEQPDEVVTVGAAIYAYHLATTNEKQSENVETKKITLKDLQFCSKKN